MMQSFLLRLLFHLQRSRHHPGRNAVRDAPAAEHFRRFLQVGQPAVRAGSDEDTVYSNLVDALPRLQMHVLQGIGKGLAPFGVGFLTRVRNAAIDRRHMLGAGTPGNLRTDLADIELYFPRSEEQTSELQSLMRNSYAVFCL